MTRYFEKFSLEIIGDFSSEIEFYTNEKMIFVKNNDGEMEEIITSPEISWRTYLTFYSGTESKVREQLLDILEMRKRGVETLERFLNKTAKTVLRIHPKGEK